MITREQYLTVMEAVKAHPEDYYSYLPEDFPQGLARVAIAISDFLLRKKGE